MYCVCRSKFKASCLIETRTLLRYCMSFPVICPIEFSLLEIGKVKWLEKCTKSNMKVVLVSGERSSNSQEESLI